MKFGRQFLDNLRARVSISSVVGSYVTLKHKGRGEFTGLCPFHKEKTPSFSVSDNKGFYHCFGCGVHGDVIGFLMEHRGLPYPEAVKELALQAGMELPKQDFYSAEKEKKIEDSYEVLEMATKWFENNLNSQAGMQARLYLKDRGLTPETIKKFRLGFAPDEWESLKNYLKNNGVDEDMILANGLVTSNEDGSKKYDRFRNRIIFPIFNSTGKVIAFGGRTMAPDKEQGPKYLNSPETDLFKKGFTLYGFNFAKDRAYKEQKIMAVEGYMDVIALHQAGFEYAVAPLGTALTENHIRIMWKISKEPIMCLDGDEAGQRASKKFAEEYIALLEPGYTIKFAFVPKGYDPDEFVKEHGKDSFEKILTDAKPLSDALWDINHAVAQLDTPEHKSEFAKKMLDLVDKIQNPSVKDFYKKEYSNRIYRLGFSGQKGGAKGKDKKTVLTPEIRSSLAKNNNRLENLKERLILVCALNPILARNADVEEVLIALEHDNKVVERLAEAVISFCADIDESGVNYNGLIEHLEVNGGHDQISYLKSNTLKGEYEWGESAHSKAIFAWRYLLAEFYLCLAEKEYEKLLENSTADISLLYEKQQEYQNNILKLAKSRDVIRIEFEDLLEEEI
jgi:DNA primase